VKANGSVTLTWSSTNASSCSAGGGWSGSLAPSGSQTQTVGTNTTVYEITCSGPGGSASANTTVTAWNPPNPTISADTTDILTNNTVSLSWSSSNATTCTGTSGLTGPLPTPGHQTSAALSSTTVFSIACSNPAYPAVTDSVTVNVSSTLTLSLTVEYQVPGAPVLDRTGYYVPDWANSVITPAPYVWVELQDPNGTVVQHTYADADGMATLSGLDPTLQYTPVIRSKINDSDLGLDFVVLNNTAPVDTSQPTYRARYAPYSNSGPAYTPGTRLAAQNLGTVLATDGWDATQSKLIDANRFAGPYALLAAAVKEAQIVSAAAGGKPTWRPLSILWSVKNKGGLSAPPNQVDQGFVTGSGGYYSQGHAGVDSGGKETGAVVFEDYEFISGDQTFEPMDLYPFVLTHEMGHFTQSLFSTLESPGGGHSYSDYEDPRVAWIEGSASGIAALALGTPHQNRVSTVNGQLVVGIDDPSSYTINQSTQQWPLGWYQEATITRLMWELYDPNGSLHLSAAQVLAPLFSPAWQAGPWLNTAWAYTAQLTDMNLGNASLIDGLADALNITSTGDDEWGSVETKPGYLGVLQALPPYTNVVIGASPVTLCSVGSPNDYNKESNVRYFRVAGDGATHTLRIQGQSGTVPLLDGALFSAGSTVYSASGTFPSGYSVFSVGDCSVSLSEFSSDTATCNEPSPPPNQCWTLSVQ